VREESTVREFVESFLRVDGVFLLRLIAHNTSGITATELTKELWDHWYDRRHVLQNVVDEASPPPPPNADDSSTEIKRRVSLPHN